MAQSFDRKILRALQDNGVRKIRAYEVVSKRLTIFQTDRGTFKYSDSLYRLVAQDKNYGGIARLVLFQKKNTISTKNKISKFERINKSP